VVKRICWFVRSPDWTAEAAGRIVSKTMELPKAEPRAGWMRSGAISVELSSEQFPGSSPVWIWEE